MLEEMSWTPLFAKKLKVSSAPLISTAGDFINIINLSINELHCDK